MVLKIVRLRVVSIVREPLDNCCAIIIYNMHTSMQLTFVRVMIIPATLQKADLDFPPLASYLIQRDSERIKLMGTQLN